MFRQHPELKDIFTMSHQQNGAQREALFNAVCAYAMNIDNLGALGAAVENCQQAARQSDDQTGTLPDCRETCLPPIEELLNPVRKSLPPG